MRGFFEVIRLEMRSLVRSKALAMLLVASVIWMFVFPCLVHGDGTVEGERELYVHYSLGGVFLILVVSLLASATGSIARERALKRLQLTLVRPVRPFAIALGKIWAHVIVGAIVLAVACAILAGRSDLSRRCSHVLSPVLVSPREEAEQMYESYMQDPSTPEEVKKAKKSIVVRLLESRARDHYQVIQTNATVEWSFPCEAGSDVCAPAVRMRFTNQYEMRQDVRGVFSLGGFSGIVSNVTQATVAVPLRRTDGGETLASAENRLRFSNEGKTALMLRPRRDLNLLVPADSFGHNLIRVYWGMLAVLAFVVSVGVFLSAGLGRSVAIFVAFVMLIVSEMSPSVVDQYPDALEKSEVDRIGLAITRCAAELTQPVSSLSSLESFSRDECVEAKEVLRLVLTDLVLLPVLLSVLSAFLLPRKVDDAL